VLEVGIGTGLSLPHYPASTSLVGVDICPKMLDKARLRQRRINGCTVDLQLVDGEQLPFGDGSFDAVVLPFVISVTPDPEHLLTEVQRVLRPSGAALMLNHFAGVRGLRWLEALCSPLAKFVGFRSDLDLDRIVAATTMQVVSVKPLPPLGFFTRVELQRG
jgi:phosphatidylethanolamine/phosphatidyl-N-methylethanolamine N-methyltransferase